VPTAPFKILDRADLEAKYGADWEAATCQDITEPVWIVNIPREFYDFEDFATGKWDNYDLFMPQYGEVLSGARREYDYKKSMKKWNASKLEKKTTPLSKNGQRRQT
jgi:asparaginyl-tRNA synthetase